MVRALSNEEFGRRIGRSASVASKLRAGKEKPSLPLCRVICEEFRIPILDLVLACLDSAEAQAEILAAAVPRIREKTSA